jgi:hypothetical protein
MIPTNLLARVLRICGPEQGTGFIVDRFPHVFVVTAAHVVQYVYPGTKIDLALRTNVKRPFEIRSKATYGDVSVLLLNEQASFVHNKCIFDTKDMFLHQDLFLLGFPFGWEMTLKMDDQTRQLSAFVKKAVYSNIGDGDQFFVDTPVNRGFSGGPVVFFKPGDFTPRVCGVISANCTKLEGFSNCYDIKLANMAIDDILSVIAVDVR